MDWSIVHSLTGFLYHNDPIEDPLLAYVNAAEALYLLLLVVLFLLPATSGSRPCAAPRSPPD